MTIMEVMIKVIIVFSFAILTNCGRVKRVIGGMAVECGAQPRVTSLRNSTSLDHLCGATIITPEYAITAAHCVHKNPEQYFLQLNNYCGQEPLPTAEVLEIIPHLLYNRVSSAHDIAVLRIRLNLDDITWLDADVLPNSSFGISGDCIIYGYGIKTTESTTTSDVLMAGKLSIVSLDKCTEILGPIVPAFDSGMICAVGDGSDACQGDSGGPLFCNSKLEGICSYGLSCGVRGVPGVYTSIGAETHRNWVLDVMAYDKFRGQPDII